jgi:hypothetical protein
METIRWSAILGSQRLWAQMSYFFCFGKICPKNLELRQNPLAPCLLVLITIKGDFYESYT